MTFPNTSNHFYKFASFDEYVYLVMPPRIHAFLSAETAQFVAPSAATSDPKVLCRLMQREMNKLERAMGRNRGYEWSESPFFTPDYETDFAYLDLTRDSAGSQAASNLSYLIDLFRESFPQLCKDGSVPCTLRALNETLSRHQIRRGLPSTGLDTEAVILAAEELLRDAGSSSD